MKETETDLQKAHREASAAWQQTNERISSLQARRQSAVDEKARAAADYDAACAAQAAGDEDADPAKHRGRIQAAESLIRGVDSLLSREQPTLESLRTNVEQLTERLRLEQLRAEVEKRAATARRLLAELAELQPLILAKAQEFNDQLRLLRGPLREGGSAAVVADIVAEVNACKAVRALCGPEVGLGATGN